MNLKTNTALKFYLQPTFVVSFLVLGVAAAGMPLLLRAFEVATQKTPLPIRKSLSLLDDNGLDGYTVVAKGAIENPEVLKTLGTEEYIEWTLEDTQVGPGDPARYCSLFITYYDMPDRVPHVPEECYVGGGFQQISSDSLKVRVSRPQSNASDMSVQFLTFSRASKDMWQGHEVFPVLYVFSVNGNYAHSRGETRLLLNKNVFSEHSYFSKVEWKFWNRTEFARIYPNKEQSAAASERLLSTILPILEQEHWPVVK